MLLLLTVSPFSFLCACYHGFAQFSKKKMKPQAQLKVRTIGELPALHSPISALTEHKERGSALTRLRMCSSNTMLCIFCRAFQNAGCEVLDFFLMFRAAFCLH